jgi:DNA-binding PadR family transcriptional regulator
MPRHKRGWAINNNDKHHKRRTPLTVALVEPALLTLIEMESRHGYGLHEALKGLGIRPIHPSVVYRTLRQMEELGWISADWDTTEGSQGPPRKIFSLTDAGVQALQTWQDELLRAQESIQLLLKGAKS